MHVEHDRADEDEDAGRKADDPEHKAQGGNERKDRGPDRRDDRSP